MTDVFHRPAMIGAIGLAVALVLALLWLALASLGGSPMQQQSAVIHVPKAQPAPHPGHVHLLPYYQPKGQAASGLPKH
jgi:hypothetical protein